MILGAPRDDAVVLDGVASEEEEEGGARETVGKVEA